MTERTLKTFDCVQAMRRARDTVSAEIEQMNYDQLVQWLRVHRYTDPALQRLAEKAAQQGDAADRPLAGR
jgi:N-acetylglucosamine kinase-like BadF-type ATPase